MIYIYLYIYILYALVYIICTLYYTSLEKVFEQDEIQWTEIQVNVAYNDQK